MPTDRDYYKERWKAAKVDFDLSYGMFVQEKLVGFIIHAVDRRAGKLTAFNTGTGVIPDYRGKRIVKSIYDYALNDLRSHGIEKSTLEVITKNDPAVRAYQGVGFNICKNYKCYAGDIKVEHDDQVELREVPLSDIDWEALPNQESYSWDFQKETILARNYKSYEVIKDKKPESFFIMDTENLYLAQFDILSHDEGSWERLFTAIKQVSEKVKVINVDDRFKEKLDIIQKVGLKNTVDQYEMDLELTPSKER